jgi:hypothetical protein
MQKDITKRTANIESKINDGGNVEPDGGSLPMIGTEKTVKCE